MEINYVNLFNTNVYIQFLNIIFNINLTKNELK